jgi:hypothetical protein
MAFLIGDTPVFAGVSGLVREYFVYPPLFFKDLRTVRGRRPRASLRAI